MRDQFEQRYFDTEHAIVTGTVTGDLEALPAAVHRLQARLSACGDLLGSRYRWSRSPRRPPGQERPSMSASGASPLCGRESHLS